MSADKMCITITKCLVVNSKLYAC